MKIEAKDIANGLYDGKRVFISDIRSNGNPFEKFIRNIEPIEVYVDSADKCKSRVYYSNSVFLKLKNGGSPSKSVIKLFDNTGYRSYTGVPVNVFDNMEECEASYKEQAEKIYGDMTEFLDYYETKRLTFAIEVFGEGYFNG